MADFVVLSTADWDHPLWTNKQHVAVSLAAAGHRVLYVDSLGLRPPRAGAADRGRILRRLRRVLRPPRQVGEALWVWSPLVLPGGTAGFALILNRQLLTLGLRLALLWLRFRQPILWTYNPLTCRYLALGSFGGSIYHCVDRIQAQPGMPAERISASERQLCRAVDVVFTTSPDLQADLEKIHPHTHFFGNVADQQHFAQALGGTLPCPPALNDLARPRLLFIGAIDAYKLDLLMLEVLAARHPEWTYVFVGPVGEADPETDVSNLRKFSNVHFVGAQSYGNLPAWLAHCDVALLPLRHNSYTRHMFPMKFFEYLASGRPVVATAIPALRPHAAAAHLCEPEADSFEVAIANAITSGGPALNERLAVAAEHTYETRTAAMLSVLNELGILPDARASGVSSGRARVRVRRLRHYWPEWLLSQLAISLAVGLDRIGAHDNAFEMLRAFRRRWPRNLPVLRALIPRSVQAGDFNYALEVMEDLWINNGQISYLRKLLFRRGSRPEDLQQQIILFETLARSVLLPLTYRCYSRVVLAYRIVESGDQVRMRESAVALESFVVQLESDPGTRICRRGNRSNRAKLLISCYSTLTRLYLELGDRKALAAIGRKAAEFMDGFDLNAIDSDTSFRLTRNLMRCLTIDVLEAWRLGEQSLYQRARQRLARVRDHCHQSIHDESNAQEDHRGFAKALLEEVDSLEQMITGPSHDPQRIHELLRLMIKNKGLSLGGVLPLFPDYLDTKVAEVCQ
ncbi:MULTISPECIES: glycosyltransferase [unclassified Prochlorococcus]|uniref:glycosyltransferase n=1 Tax=unclassified Prochlorococcus TaxID=2627481 RepID=UPI0005337E68|nr:MULTISPECIES: glycosyltransferase [unclassified Prochlorococcus]KGG26661.1 Glycosyltransferase [Prochlorococcus sp. MIT 0701]KGG30216.1 Glycosyltransferase [Prochlorococcus sp. MIT 0702]KGG34965.1 Glycosyltransferase [Prochlorococcus sp. MIT 0703]